MKRLFLQNPVDGFPKVLLLALLSSNQIVNKISPPAACSEENYIGLNFCISIDRECMSKDLKVSSRLVV